MPMVIVPNELADAIHAKISAAIAELPEGEHETAEADRPALYQHLLSYFDEHGMIPDFSLQKKEPTDAAD